MVEVKWVHFPDKEYALRPFEELLKRYWDFDVFLGYSTYWYDVVCTPEEREAMDQYLRPLPTVALTLTLTNICQILATRQGGPAGGPGPHRRGRHRGLAGRVP